MNGLVVVLLLMVGLVVAIWVFYEFILGSSAADERHRQTIARGKRPAFDSRDYNEAMARMREERLSAYRQTEIKKATDEFQQYLDRLY
ncbi:hypothetical protein [Mycobacteroides abscessus]|uniref:hypothetical protein n=1 Tax=Mycobacteroides abscessus TaxID=36809 RepID=UPI0009258F70|nr:hypothetical protein [Mycobacteroides abscessus]SIC58705.1 Uncharacterised protein [Mycobacteroides abscessus subsp. abscessus]